MKRVVYILCGCAMALALASATGHGSPPAGGSTCYNLTNAPCTTLTNGAVCLLSCPNGDGFHEGTVVDRGSGSACYSLPSGSEASTGQTGCSDGTTSCKYKCRAICGLTGLPIEVQKTGRMEKVLSGDYCP